MKLTTEMLSDAQKKNEILIEALKKIARTYPNYHRIGREPRRIAEKALEAAGETV